MDVHDGSDVAPVLFLKHTFDENETSVLVQIYLIDTPPNSDAVRISCTQRALRIDFLSSSQPNEGNRVWSRWQLSLRGTIVPEKCSYRILPNRARIGVQRWLAKVELQLQKSEEMKWVNLESGKTVTELESATASSDWHTLICEPSQVAIRNFLSSPKRSDSTTRTVSASMKSGSNTNPKAPSKKPFCLVSPNNAQNTTFAGYTGIENQKNCCFMNAVLQVLANTRAVREFAAHSEVEDYESAMKRLRTDGMTVVESDKFLRGSNVDTRRGDRDRDRDRKVAARGELLRAFCTIVNELWTGTQSYVAPTIFRTVFCSRYAHFAGSLQQDAHEFLTFFLDGMRDELRHREIAESEAESNVNRAGVACTAESSTSALTDADSLSFLKAFLGELRSEICCMECEHVSTRRDAFYCLSVPIPKPATHVFVHFMSYLPSVRPRSLEIELPTSPDDRAPCTLNVLRQVATQMRCRVPDLRMYEVHQGRFHRLFTPHSTLDEIAPGDQLVVQQVIGPPSHDGQYIELFVTQRVLLPNLQFAVCCYCHAQTEAVNLKRCKRCYRVAYCSRDCQVKHYAEHASWCRYVPALVGCPFILSIPRARASFDYVCERMQQYALWSVDVTYRTPPPLLHALTSVSSASSQAVATGAGNASGAGSSTTNSIDVDVPSFPSMPELVSPPIEDSHCVMDCAVCTNADGSHPQLALMLADASGQPFRIPKPDPEKGAKCETDAATVSNTGSFNNRRKFMFVVKEANEHGLETGRILEPNAANSSEPLDFTGWKYIYMDWLNKDRNRPYVLVESKPSLGADTPLDDASAAAAAASASAPAGLVASEDSGRSCAASVNVNGNPSLYDCLSSFTECEMLHAGEAWRCPRCDHLQAASKQLTISRAPDVLIVHLKRFKPNREKLDVHVDFPVLALDIGKFVVPDRDASLAAIDNDSKTQLQSEYLYDLYATVNHFGVTTGGHYTAYARLVDANDSTRSEFGWREFDDASVKVLNDANVVRSRHAYLLFYKRRSALLPPITG